MFYWCCTQWKDNKKAEHVIQVTEKQRDKQSIKQKQKSMKLKAYIPANSKQVNIFNINKQRIGKNTNILSLFQNNSDQFDDFVAKKVMKSNYETLKEQYARLNQNWVDQDFPPEQRSFGLQRQTQKVNWKRIGQIIKNPVFIKNKADPSDILQGRIGNCYFLSAICGLAEDQNRILALFSSYQINRNGIYMARILHKGVLKEIVVDDYFPVSKIDGCLVCSNPAGGNQIWVMVLEKCWAKLFGSYEAIDGGLPNQVLHAFSGAPIYQYLTEQLSQQQTQDLFNKMLQSDARNHVICCGTHDNQEVQDHGLVLGHAYTILSIFDKPYRLLKIRNPWGQRQWNGRASQSDKKFWKSISNYDKKRLGYVEEDNGIFFMLWQDFLQHFSIVDICKIQKDSNYYYEELSYQKGRGLFSELMTRGGEATVALSQQNTRGMEVPKPRYASSTLMIAKKTKNLRNVEDYQYHSCLSTSNTCDINLELANLQTGSYIIYSFLNGRNSSQDATLSCYSQAPVQLLPMKINQDQFFNKMFISHARKNINNHQRIFGNQDVWVCMDILTQSGFAYTVVHVGQTAKMKLGLTFNEDQYRQNNFELLPPNKGKNIFKIVCNSGQESIVVCRIMPQNFAIQASLPVPTIKKLF